MKRILVIDDDTELCELLIEYLEREGFEVTAINDGNEGLEEALSSEFALIVLDIMLPSLGGFEVLQSLRLKSDVPVLMLTARGEDVDRIVGLELGADDYLPKPFNPRELVARIRAILRRAKPQSLDEALLAPPPVSGKIVVGDIEMDIGTRIVNRQAKRVELTSVEFGLLEILLRAAGRIVSRDELAKGALGRGLGSYDRSIDVHISSLRRKLGQYPDGIERIKTVRGAGYLYAPLATGVEGGEPGNTD